MPYQPYLRETKESSDELLKSGNYAYAFYKASDPETRACARIMCGSIETGLAELAACNGISQYSSLIQAYGYWCLKKKKYALEILSGVESEKAKKFSGFIQNGAEVLIFSTTGEDKIKDFDDIKISYQSIKLENFKKNISDKDKNKDLIISYGAYGVNLPNNIFDIECPIAFWVSDHDFFYSTRYSDLSRATVLITNSAGEHCELSQHYSSRIASFPGHEFYRNSDYFHEPSHIKKFDICFTGKAFVPYMRDKAQFLYQFIKLNEPELDIRIYDGYLQEEQFMSVMANSRFIPLFWRYAGGIQTRAIDAIRQGANVFSPEKLTAGVLIKGVEAGFVSLCSGVSSQLVRKYIKDYEAIVERRHDNNLFKDLFWSQPYREQRFVKFCLFQTILTQTPDVAIANNLPLPAELRGYSEKNARKLYTSIAKYNMSASIKGVAHYNFAAAAALYAATAGDGNARLGQISVEIYTMGQEKFPNNLILKFNAARALWLFGAKSEASPIFDELSRSDEKHDFDPTDGVLSHRIQALSEMFSYGDYFQAALNDPIRARKIIQSSALTYLGVYAFETNQVKEAAKFLRKAVTIFTENVAAYKWLTKVLVCLSADAKEILGVFYKAINLYPPNLCDLLPYGVEAELSTGNEEKASALLNNWVLYHWRVREPSGKLLSLNERSLRIIYDNQFLLDDWIIEKFEKIKKEALD